VSEQRCPTCGGTVLVEKIPGKTFTLRNMTMNEDDPLYRFTAITPPALDALEVAVVDAAVAYVRAPDEDVETYGYYSALVAAVDALRAAQDRALAADTP
jgi:hypothetical protein